MQMQELVVREAQAELARRHFYDYCQVMHPDFYTEDRQYLRQVCETLQGFMEQNEKRFLVINMPPRHLKSFTGTNLVEWLFGKDPSRKVMTGSYNETLSTTFARKVRDTIDTRSLRNGRIVYRNIFPFSKIKYGQASASLWALEGTGQDSYLATSPTGTATGFGANVVLIDDIIKNAEEAYNDTKLEQIWDWFTNTMMQRLEGDDWKVIVIMTRWATGDLAGRILENYPNEVEHITFSAKQADGTMLAPSILNEHDYILKTQEMNVDIVEANYNQVPIDVKGKLYGDFMTWEKLPEGVFTKKNYTDTADTGTDFLCSLNYIFDGKDVYITDAYMSDAKMEDTEPEVADLLHRDQINEATFESNNGGKGFARNVDRILKEVLANIKTVITWTPQTHNKEARILASSAWVAQHVYMPLNWKTKYPELYKQLSKYQKKGKNEHDDAPDVLAAIYEECTRPKVSYATSR